jgi:hypothetical protein
MTPEEKKALSVKELVVEVMKDYVFAGDFENPRRSPDSAGKYHYADPKITIACLPSRREGWLNCAVELSLIRKRWFSRKLETVLSTGHGVDVWVFRPGLWIDYVSNLAELAAGRTRERELKQAADAGVSEEDPRFAPIDDSAIFKK